VKREKKEKTRHKWRTEGEREKGEERKQKEKMKTRRRVSHKSNLFISLMIKMKKHKDLKVL
jgi:hypothetical protein